MAIDGLWSYNKDVDLSIEEPATEDIIRELFTGKDYA